MQECRNSTFNICNPEIVSFVSSSVHASESSVVKKTSQLIENFFYNTKDTKEITEYTEVRNQNLRIRALIRKTSWDPNRKISFSSVKNIQKRYFSGRRS